MEKVLIDGRVVAIRRGATGHTSSIDAISVSAGESHVDCSKLESLTIRRHGGLGDLLLLQPVLRELHSLFGLRIILETDPNYFFLFENDPCINHLCSHTSGEVVDLSTYPETHKMRQSLNRTDIFSLAFGLRLANRKPYYKPTDEMLRHGEKLAGDNCIVVVLKASTESRTWARAYDLYKKLLEAGYNAVLVDGNGFGEDLPSNYTGQLTLPAVIGLIAKASLVVTPDSGLMHVAAAVGTPFLLTFFGADDVSSPDIRCGYYSNYTVESTASLGHIYDRVIGIMSGERIGRYLISSESGTVERGNRIYRFVSGIPLFVDEIDAVDLLVNPRFSEQAATEEDTHDRTILWVIPSFGFGGAEIHTSRLMSSMKGHNYRNIILLTRPTTGGSELKTEFSQNCDKLESGDYYTSHDISPIVRYHDPDLIIFPFCTNVDSEIRKTALDCPALCVVHTLLDIPKLPNTVYVYTSLAAAEGSSFDPESGFEFIIPNGVDVVEWASGRNVRDRLNIPVDAFVILYCGRLSPEKNVGALIDVMERLPADTYLIIAGDGPERHLLQDTARKWGVEDRVLFRGYIQPRGVRNLMASSDCLAITSDVESLPLVALEAMAARLAIVYTPVGDLPKCVGDNGFQIDKSNPDGLFEALSLARVSPKRDDMTANAFRNVWNFNEQENHRAYWNIIGDLLGQPLVTFIISCDHVHIRPLGPTIQSIMDQKYPNIEILLVGAADEEHVDRWAKLDSRIFDLTVRDEVSVIAGLNLGLELGRGHFIVMAESGDVFDTSMIDLLIEEDSPVTVWGYSSKSSDIKPPIDAAGYPDIHKDYRTPLACMSFNRTIFQQIPLLNEDLEILHTEEFLLKLFVAVEGAVRVIPRTLVRNIHVPTLTPTGEAALRHDNAVFEYLQQLKSISGD